MKINNRYTQYNNTWYYYNRRSYFNWDKPVWENPKEIGKMAKTPTRGRNGDFPRKYGVTRKEIMNSLDALDSLEEMNYNIKIRNLNFNHGDMWLYG